MKKTKQHSKRKPKMTLFRNYISELVCRYGTVGDYGREKINFQFFLTQKALLFIAGGHTPDS